MHDNPAYDQSADGNAPDIHCRCGYFGPFIYSGWLPDEERRECPRCGRYETEANAR